MRGELRLLIIAGACTVAGKEGRCAVLDMELRRKNRNQRCNLKALT